MNNDILVSIIVPIFNMEKYLAKCIDSLLEQSHIQIEIILVDDGSKDDSLSICHGYAKKYDNIKVISQANSGVSVARNTGLYKSKGEWVMFVDPDDYLSKNIITELLDNINQETDVVACSCIAFENDEEHICHLFQYDTIFDTYEKKKDLYKQLMKLDYGQNPDFVYTAIGVPWGKIYRKSLLDAGIRFNPDLKRVQDNLFNMEVFCQSRIVKYIDKPLYYYRFEHMNGYFQKYRSNLTDIYTAVTGYRCDTMKKYGLMDDEELKTFYINEAVSNLACITRFCVFHKDNPKTQSEKRKELIEILENKYFSECIDLRLINRVNGMRMKLFLILARFRSYEVLSILFNAI